MVLDGLGCSVMYQLVIELDYKIWKWYFRWKEELKWNIKRNMFGLFAFCCFMFFLFLDFVDLFVNAINSAAKIVCFGIMRDLCNSSGINSKIDVWKVNRISNDGKRCVGGWYWQLVQEKFLLKSLVLSFNGSILVFKRRWRWWNPEISDPGGDALLNRLLKPYVFVVTIYL